MTRELEEKLYNDFPELFKEKDLPASQTCMCWGIECEDGWEPIVRNMCRLLTCKSTVYMGLKPIFPYADKLERFLDYKTNSLFRWLERKLNLPYHTIKLPQTTRVANFPGWGVRFTQIKEKFGTLRVYYSVYPLSTAEESSKFNKETVRKEWERFQGYVEGVTRFAEYLSSKTCERDGKPGRLTGGGWITTLCTDCCPDVTEEEK